MTKFKTFALSPLALGSALVIGLFPGGVRAAGIDAPAAYFSTQTAGPENVTLNGKTYRVTVTAIPLSYFTYCSWILNGMMRTSGGNPLFPNDQNVAFTGFGQGSNLSPVAASDFTVSNYTPWAVNNNTNGKLPDGSKIQGGERNVDGGGTNIVISYQPTANDPTRVNWVQATVATLNGDYITPINVAPGDSPSGLSGGFIDANPNLSPLSPFYNVNSAAGTGTTYRGGVTNADDSIRPGTNPLVASVRPAVPAWMGDSPAFYSNDGAVFTYTQTFQAFIESTQPINGTTYDVMYGGVQWGHTVTSVAVPAPEPGTWTLGTIGAFGLTVFAHMARRTKAATVGAAAG